MKRRRCLDNPDSAANYQFVVDALSKKKDKKEPEKPKDRFEGPGLFE